MHTATVPSVRTKLVTAALCIGWLVLIAVIVLWPTPVDSGAAGFVGRVLADLHAAGLPAWIDYSFAEFTANILLFVPLGAGAAIVLAPGWRWLGPAVALLMSVTIEFVQFTVLPARFATWYDVLANASGAAFGAIVGRWWLHQRDRRRPATQKPPAPPAD